MFKKLLFFFIFFIFFANIKAEIVNEVQIQGNKRISNETIKIYGDINVNKDYSKKDLNQILKNLYEIDLKKFCNTFLLFNILN